MHGASCVYSVMWSVKSLLCYIQLSLESEKQLNNLWLSNNSWTLSTPGQIYLPSLTHENYMPIGQKE